MLKAYEDYKAWWIEHNSFIFKDTEDAFAGHINGYGNYGLLEMLVDWSKSVEIPTGN